MKNIKAKLTDRKLKLYIDNLLHLEIELRDYIGCQAWIEGYDKETSFHIEYYFKSGTIESEYNNEKLWKTILKILDKEL